MSSRFPPMPKVQMPPLPNRPLPPLPNPPTQEMAASLIQRGVPKLPMTPPIRSADAPWKQPKAICSLVSMRWCSLMVGTELADRKVMELLLGSNLTETMKIHKDKDLSKPSFKVRNGWTKEHQLLTGGCGFVCFVTELWEVGSNCEPQKIVDGLCSHVRGKDSVGFTVSLKYNYPATKKHSGHSVGFFFNPDPDKKRTHTEFFDPNYGAWEFSSMTECTEFFRNEWLPRFLSGTLRGDPGDVSRDKQRVLYEYKVHQVTVKKSGKSFGELIAGMPSKRPSNY